MRVSQWYLLLAALLVVISAAAYALQVFIFGKPEDTFFYLLQDLAFLPIQVLLVTLILNDLMARRERSGRLQKLNMVIGAFFSQHGYRLIGLMSQLDSSRESLGRHLGLGMDWGSSRFASARSFLNAYQPTIEPTPESLAELRGVLFQGKHFLLGLLENPALLEHASFTDLLWALTHLAEELEFRKDLGGLPPPDLGHLGSDVKRAYGLLLSEWLSYLEHLRNQYPYIYSLAVRTNPFDPNAKVAVS